ncbi:hypothetical protein ORI20_14045 [Mycobacterium sp. CVI_P3]|uniref:hypothetical protein n=1 Tax=Mycobacterium pinniadriaticum TaxID=2994102 RepID=UPI0022492E71|nr:hypothetical protein [Mycobacterium pinniadriaticum]MCX2931402.1 hypothetical protein [Mycobacterium pinniadriaticum]
MTHVSVRDDNGTVHSFGPGSDVPAWAKAKITNPKVWEGGDDVAADPTPGGDQGSSSSGGGGDVEPPPLGGAGSGRDHWADYAANFADKVTISEDDKRDDIVDKLREAGIRVE